MSTPTFMPGLKLSRILFEDLVQPLMAQHAPDLAYAAGLFGAGSDVLGYDTARSMDHDWGPRLILLLDEQDWDGWSSRLDAMFRRSLPRLVAGFPTGTAEFETEPGTRHMIEADGDEPIDHLITITTVGRWFGGIAQVNVDTSQWLLEATSGEIFRDDIGSLTKVRAALAWYPDEVWRYVMAAQWMRIDQLEPFIGRCGEAGDDLGSQLVAMTLVRDAMRLEFLLERRYAPYPKWFGTGFQRLALAPALIPHLDRARFATTWREREAGVVAAVETLAHRHNDLGLTPWIDPTPRPFHSRPFTIIGGARFSEALLASIADPKVRALPLHLGGLDQYVDSTDALNNGALHRAIRHWMRDSGA